MLTSQLTVVAAAPVTLTWTDVPLMPKFTAQAVEAVLWLCSTVDEPTWATTPLELSHDE
jgi:hypothetical protein